MRRRGLAGLLVPGFLMVAAAGPAPGEPAPAQPGSAQPGSAQPGPGQPALPSGTQWVPRGTADLIALNKIDAQSTRLQVPVGQSVQYGSLSIAVRSCQVRPADMAPDATAWIDIADSRPGAPGFHGWMLENEPNLNSFEHPVYDVRLAGCR
jgi:hypothetical protein